MMVTFLFRLGSIIYNMSEDKVCDIIYAKYKSGESECVSLFCDEMCVFVIGLVENKRATLKESTVVPSNALILVYFN